MLSVLIPVLNYNVDSLIKELHKQLLAESIEFEILFFEDGSNEKNIAKNKHLSELLYVKQFVSTENLGRLKVRKILARNAKYTWVLFLDADVIPKNQDFISSYRTFLSSNLEVIYGGFYYSKEKPNKDSILRWKYGIHYEEISYIKRNQKPYKVIISANCLIKKNTFLSLDINEDNKTYGLDSLIGDRLRKNQSKILHIDNQVIHLGLENNFTFLNKKEQVSKILLEMYYEQKMNSNPENSLLSLFSKIKRIGLNYVIVWIFKIFKGKMKANFLSSNPSMLLFQFYRLSHLCYTDLKNY